MRQIVACMTVATACQSAAVGAGIGIALIPIVAVFNTSLYESIAASGCLTGIGACIGIDAVAIIARFFALSDAVTAAS